MTWDDFIAQSYRVQSLRLDCEETINLTLETGKEGKKHFYRTPGHRAIYDSGTNEDGRGALSVNGHIFVAQGAFVKDFTFDGATLTLTNTYGPIGDDGRKVRIVANSALTQAVVVSAGDAYLMSGTTTLITWMGVPVIDVAIINDFFLFLPALGDGFFYSEPGDANAGSALGNFVAMEGDATRFSRIIVRRNTDVFVFGQSATQVYYNSTDPQHPFKKNQTASMASGISAPDSAILYDGRIWWIDENSVGRCTNGFVPESFTTYAVEQQWRKYGDLSLAFSIAVEWSGHSVLRFTFPNATENISTTSGIVITLGMTWQYDIKEQDWTKVPAWDSATGRFVSGRGGASSQPLLGKQLVVDRSNGKIYILDPEYYFDNGVRVPWLRRSPIIDNEGRRVSYPGFRLGIQTGVGDGTNLDPALGTVTPEANPVVYMRYSDDWGQNFTNELYRALGPQGSYLEWVYWSRCGAGEYRVFEIGGSAACPINIDWASLDEPEAWAA